MNINRRKALKLFASTLLITLFLLNIVSFALPKPMPDSNSGRSTTTQIEDEIPAATPLSGSTIVVDGYPGDWAGILPIVSDVKYDASSPYDIHDVYVTDDGTYLYLMMELDSMGAVGLYFDLDVDQNIATGYNTNLDPMGYYMNPHDTGIDFEIWVSLNYPSVLAALYQFFADGLSVYIKDVAVAAEIVVETCVLLSDIGEPAPPSINMDFQAWYGGSQDEAPDIGCVTYAPYAPSLVPEDLELYPREVVDLPPNPTGTQWHELHPNTTNFYEITSWEPGEVLSPCDAVEMEPLSPAGPLEFFDVDEVTIGIVLYDDYEGIERWLYYECGYWTFKKDVWTDPVCSKWIEIKNEYGPVVPPRCWHLTNWYDDGDGKLSYMDAIEMTPMYPYPGPTMFAEVDQVTVNLKLENMANLTRFYLEFMGSLDEFQDMDYIHRPEATLWHEILPEQGRIWSLAYWYESFMFSPADQIVLTRKDPETHEPIPGTEAEYHVDKLTVAMNLTSTLDAETHIVKFEGSLKEFMKYHWWEWPLGPNSTQWHEVNPTYCRQWYLEDWLDDGDSMLDYCDYIIMIDKETGWIEEFHVESLSTDIWVTQKPPPPPPAVPPEDLELYPREVVDLMDPTGTQWHELHPNTTNFYEIASWEPGRVLSPEDIVVMNDKAFQVDEVTIGIIVYDYDEGIYRWLYYECGYWTFKKDVWTDPVCSKWIEIKNEYGPVVPPRCWHLTNWYDDGDGKLSDLDEIEMTPMYPYPGPTTVCFVEWVTVNLKLTEEPAPTPPVQYYLEFAASLDDFQYMDYIHMPWTTWWYEILPVDFRVWELTNWVDRPFLSPSDQITLVSTEESYRFVVMIGDAPAHAAPSGPGVLPGYPAHGYGGDPGRDEIMFTGDDLDYVPVIDKIASEGITVFTVNYWYDPVDNPDAYTNFDYIANRTGGVHYDGTTAWDVSIANEIATRIGTGRGDVVFAYDLSGSMPPYFNEMKGKSKAIIDALSTLDVGFGVGTFVDYPDYYDSYGYEEQYGDPYSGDYAWSMDTDITDAATAKSVIESVVSGYYDGWDWPQNYVRVLYECQYFNWGEATVGEYHVDKLTVAMNLTSTYDGKEHIVKFEGSLQQFKKYHWYDPISTQWHEVNPTYCRQWHIMDWIDSGTVPGILDYCDYIVMVDKETGEYEEFHVESLSTDIWVSEKPPPAPLEDLELYPREVVDLMDPTGTQWHELHPSKTNFYNLISWEPGMVLSPEDIVYMDGTPFEVDEVTIGIVLYDDYEGILRWLYYECGYWTFMKDVWTDPVGSKWIEIKNENGTVLPPRCWHLTSWYDDGDGKLSMYDAIEMTPTHPYPGPTTVCFVDWVTVNLKLTEEPAPTPPVQYYLEFEGSLDDFQYMDYIHDPEGTWWYEILPSQGRYWQLTNWADAPMLSPSDQITLISKDPETHIPIPGTEADYHVDKLTVAMNLTSVMIGKEHIVKFEGSLQQFKKYHWYDPRETQWHEVNPDYCRQWYLFDYFDQDGDFMLSPGDWVFMIDKETGWPEDFIVESLSTDIWVTQLIHDVAVVDVTPDKTVVEPGSNVTIYVTVANEGDLAETFNVYAYANTTIGTLVVNNLPPGNQTILTFVWDTTGWTTGNYTISATAVLPGDNDPGDNTFIDGTVYVGVHDVAVTDVTPSRTVVCQGDSMNINVTVENQGDLTETFNVTLYCNSSVINSITVTDLPPGENTTLTFTWNTTGVAKGDYTIKAEATPVPYEIDLGDNILIDGQITVTWLDVAVVDVTLSRTVVCQGDSMNINVTVENQGDLTETFNVTLYCNSSVINSITVTDLPPGENTTLTFTWDTGGFSYGNYTVKAVADTVPGETDTIDNVYVDGVVKVVIPGDINGDGIVDIYDAIRLAVAFGSEPDDPNWNPNADINGDEIVDIYDAIILAIHFGEES
jgi:hypothetical protein